MMPTTSTRTEYCKRCGYIMYQFKDHCPFCGLSYGWVTVTPAQQPKKGFKDKEDLKKNEFVDFLNNKRKQQWKKSK